MQIKAVTLKAPSKLITNDFILSIIEEANVTLPKSEVLTYCKQLEALFDRAGCKTRYVRDRENGETAQVLMQQAVRDAIAKSGVAPEEIDLMIFCGVGRGFLEPSNAAFLSHSLGLKCEFFDVADACMSWVRSLHLAYQLLKGGDRYRNILIVNGEFTTYEFGIPDIFKINSMEQLRYSFPAMTIGEAATATVVGPSDKLWSFKFRTDASHAHLCTLTLPGASDYAGQHDSIGINGLLRLVSFGKQLTYHALRQMIDFAMDNYDFSELAKIDICFPHAPSDPVVAAAARRLRLGDRLYSNLFSRYGNLISASIPAAMSLAIDEGKLVRGNRIVMCPASAGISLGLVDGVY